MTKRRVQSVGYSRGFSLVEVMVALVVCAIGLLGLAKMESLAISSTGVASTRSIAAIQAASLASAMRANGAFWAAGFAPSTTTVNIVGGVVTITQSTAVPEFGVNQNCAAVAPGCSPAAMAAYDTQQWAAALKQQGQLQALQATITCSTTGFPVTCTIQLVWAENAVAMNSSTVATSGQTAAQMANLQNQTFAAPYILYVQP
jgi:type IV pilus assembly protein PilV